MNAHTPVRPENPFEDAYCVDDAIERVWNPMGHDAPKHSVEWSNYTAASIAAREVRGRAIHSEAHRRSLAAWEAGLRAWPWPEPTMAEVEAADKDAWGLAVDLVDLARGHRQFVRGGL